MLTLTLSQFEFSVYGSGRAAMSSECQWCLYVAILVITPVAMWCKMAFNEILAVSSGQLLMVNLEDERGGGHTLQYVVNSDDRLTGESDYNATNDTIGTAGTAGTYDMGGWRVMEV